MILEHEHLIGREYEPGQVHCYALIRDLYKLNFDIDLPTFTVPANWDPDKLNLVEMGLGRLEAEKLYDWSIGTLRPGDVLVMAVFSSNPNHLGIYLGENKFMHHPYGKLATVETLRDFWRMATCYVMRHKTAPDLTPVKPDITIEELLRARYNQVAEA